MLPEGCEVCPRWLYLNQASQSFLPVILVETCTWTTLLYCLDRTQTAPDINHRLSSCLIGILFLVTLGICSNSLSSFCRGPFQGSVPLRPSLIGILFLMTLGICSNSLSSFCREPFQISVPLLPGLFPWDLELLHIPCADGC